ncbi:MAG: hypothetical protein GVY13_16380 [Alphaproteobacteria bacterium]|jgi:hypothetical protein|nr:hypothetical protein [Alphaproteobacteria bacterium]
MAETDHSKDTTAADGGKRTDVVKVTEAGILKGDRFFLTFAENDGGKVSLAFPSNLTTSILTAIRATQRAHAKLPKPQLRDLSEIPPIRKVRVDTDVLGRSVSVALTTNQGLELMLKLTPEMARELAEGLVRGARNCAEQQKPSHPHEVN